jgi:methyltransferase-like protein 6
MSGSDENAGLFGESDVENLLAAQGDGSRISDFRKAQLERDARKNWDKFYLRNETNFFKDRHWTTREFKDLTAFDDGDQDSGGVTTKKRQRTLLEVGCGVGNFVFPLVEDGLEWLVL